MDLISKIRHLVREMPPGKTQTELARLMGVDRTSVNRIGAGKRRIYAEELPVLIKYLEVDGAFPFPVSGGKMAPVAGKVEAGVWREAEVSQEEKRSFPEFPTDRYQGAPQYFLEVQGTSMDKHYASGDYACCIPLEHGRLYSGVHVHVERTDAAGRVESTLKVYVETPHGVELRPESRDPAHQAPIIYTDKPDTTVEIKGLVIGSFRRAP